MPGRAHSGNARNGTRTKTVTTDIGPIELACVPGSDRDVPAGDGAQAQPAPGGVDQMALSPSAKGLTHGEISAHLEEIYGAKVSKETVTRITDGILETMTEWQGALEPCGDERTPPSGSSQQAGEAEGSLTLGRGEGGSSPDNAGTGQHCQMVRVRQARRKGVREEPASERSSSDPTSSNLADLGWVAARTRSTSWRGTLGRVTSPAGRPR